MSGELQKIRRNDLPPGVRRFFDWLMDAAKNVNGIGIRRHPVEDIFFLDYDLVIPMEINGKKEKYPFMINMRIESIHEGLYAMTFTCRLCAFCIGNSEILNHLNELHFVVNKIDSEGILFKIYLVLGDKFLFKIVLNKMNGNFGPIDGIEAVQVVFVNSMETFLTNLNLFENAIMNITKLFTGAIDRQIIRPWGEPMKEKSDTGGIDKEIFKI